jgi:excisionase family DNA binding protein
MDQTYYTLDEAATLLLIGEPTLRRLRAEGTLRTVVGEGGRVLVLAEDVNELYEQRADRGRTRRQDDELRARVSTLEQQLALIRHIPLFENTRDPMPRGRLGLEREAARSLLASPTWTWDQVLDAASWCNRMCPEEVSMLIDDFGPAALAPWVDLLNRMKNLTSDSAAPDGHDFTTMRSLIDRSLLHLANLLFYRSRLDPKKVSAATAEVLEQLLDPTKDLDALLLDAILSLPLAA